MHSIIGRAAVRGGLVAALTALVCVLSVALPATAQEKGKKIMVGQPAPDIELPATQIGTALPDKKVAKKLQLKDFKGKKNVVLWFFPKALTGG
jgi:hypothetical protein